MFRRLGRKKLFAIPLAFLLLALCVSALILRPASAAASTLAQAGAQSGRTIGVAVEANLLGNNPYTNIIQTQFDGVTPGNEMKWQTTEPQQGVFNFGPADQIVSFAQSHNMKIRGHTLVWYSQLASWVNSVPSSQILSVMENHITTEMQHFAGKIWYWDVVNEAFNDDGTRRSDVFQNEIGNAYIEDAFRTARAADPNAKLCYNDYNIEDMNSAKSQAVYAMVADFKNRGVPIDCVGFQSHFITGQVPADFQQTLQKFANLGIDVQITELDDRMPTPPSQANINQQNIDYANVAKACLAVSRCNDITIWGVGEPDSWIPSTFPGQGNALLYDSNYQPKPCYTSFLNALSSSSGTPTPTPTNTPTPTPIGNGSGYAVNAGGSATGSFAADELFSGGSTNSTTNTITTTGVTNPAPQAVYQTERYGNFTYTFPNLSPGGTYMVRLHEAEFFWSSTGQRVFNVSINGQQVLTNFDIIAAAGGADKAIVEQFTTTATSGGQIVIQFTTVTDNAKVSGIEILAGSSGVTPTPTPTQTGSTPTPTPTVGNTGSSCSVHYVISNQWSTGFTATINITNTGSTTINGWTLQFTFPNGQVIQAGPWNGTFSQSGSAVTVTNLSYNGTIPPGGSLASPPGFNASWSGSNQAPTAFTLNGAACSVV
jgi:endo-1,4-beta-xylanase